MIKVDFPDPVEPIKATVSPGEASKEISFKTYSSASGYLNETFLKTILPLLSVLPLNSPSWTLEVESNTHLPFWRS